MPVNAHECRACRRGAGHVVLDLGSQPACDYFPRIGRSGTRPGLPAADVALLALRPRTVARRPDRAGRTQGHRARRTRRAGRRRRARVAAAGLLRAGARVAEYGSPHGGSWLGLLADRGLRPVDGAARPTSSSTASA